MASRPKQPKYARNKNILVIGGSGSGKTQKEVREKMQAAAVALNDNTYQEPSRLSVGKWLDVWESEYLGAVKPARWTATNPQLETI